MLGRARREYRVYAEDRFLAAEDVGQEDAPHGADSPGEWSEDASLAARLPAGWSEDASPGVASVDGWPEDAVPAGSSREAWSEAASSDEGLGPLHRASRKRGRGLGRRAAGAAAIAAVAMALSAILAHALRSAIDGAGARRPAAAEGASGNDVSARRGARRLRGVRTPARVDAVRPSVTFAISSYAGGSRGSHPGTAADARRSAGAAARASSGDGVAPVEPHVGGERAVASTDTPASWAGGEAVGAAAGESTAGDEVAAASPEFGFER
jgi:hypothetical protein